MRAKKQVSVLPGYMTLAKQKPVPFVFDNIRCVSRQIDPSSAIIWLRDGSYHYGSRL